MLIDTDKINNINTRHRYGFKVKQISHNTCYVDSGQEEWLIEATPRTKGIILWHKNQKWDVDNYHIQREFYDYISAMNSIHTHKDKYKHKYDKVFRMKELFHQIGL
jgi:hypothetical protein